MDLHISADGEIPIDALIEKHKSDLATQKKYGVTFKSVWVNKEKGIVFCLMEGPDKKACVSVHQQAHGDTGCHIIEVDPGAFNDFLADSIADEHDLAFTEKGILDTAYRTILGFEIIDPGGSRKTVLRLAEEYILKCRGRVLLDPGYAIRAVFVYPSAAFSCARQIWEAIDAEATEFRMNIVAGKPVEQGHDDFYGYATQLSHRMIQIGKKGSILTTQLTMELYGKEGGAQNKSPGKLVVLSPGEEQFLYRLAGVMQDNFRDPGFDTNMLAACMLQSRSQVFKKTKGITGMSPNTLIREMRLMEAFHNLGRRTDQIAQIAFDSGFNSPSYFSKMFARRFGMLPSDYQKASTE